MPEKTWDPEPLREAVWKDEPGAGAEQPRGAPSFNGFLERAEDLGGEINGVAYTTSGAYSVRRAGLPASHPDREGWTVRFPGAGDRPGHGLRVAPVAGDGQEDRRRRQRRRRGRRPGP